MSIILSNPQLARWIKCLAPVYLCLQFGGCNGTLYTDDPGVLKKAGVRAYPPATWLDEYVTTIAIDKEGNVVAIANGDGQNRCFPVRVQKINTRPDYSKPYYIVYEPGMLEKFEFEVELDGGMLKKVGTKSDPDRGQTFQNLAAAAKDAASIAAGAAVADKMKVCNSGEKFVQTRKLCGLDCPTDETKVQEGTDGTHKRDPLK